MTKNLRLKKAREKKGLTLEQVGALYGEKGVSHSYIDQLEGGKNYRRGVAEKLAIILDVTADWLLFGIEQVTNFEELDNVRTLTVEKRKGVPYYNIDMTAGITSSFNDITAEPEYYVDIKPVNDCTAYVNIVGDSMLPLYTSGDTVGVKQVFNFNIIQWGEAYLVITDDSANNLKTVKNIFPYRDDDSRIILRSANPDFYGDTPINKESILSLYIVKAVYKIKQL